MIFEIYFSEIKYRSTGGRDDKCLSLCDKCKQNNLCISMTSVVDYQINLNYFILKRAQLLSFRHFSMSKKKINIIRIYCTIPKTDYPQPKSCNFVCVSSCHEDKDAMHCKRMSCNCLLLQIPPQRF